ncbi:hypothetical protein EXIGLDRAFT_781699 [Exidia glandulosa HHB12029]|uniref:Transmembrane protein n=1 Tax=Exidia glandulosa HHB12029 TaxID=1314781 RepID=A0A165B629_EXIGL|nr:hypothetical protein EXIGLDRAFT_781699 [Exidia glandulosa HHB12029]
MDQLEMSEENPAPPKPVPTRVRYALATRRESAARRARPWMCLIIFLVVLLGCHAILAVVVLYYSQAEAYPLPRGIVNRTYHGLTAFAAFAYILGAFVGLSNACLCINGFRPLYPAARRSCCFKTLFWMPLFLGGTCIGLFFVLSPLIFSSIRQDSAYAHTCDNDWITVLFTGHRYNALDKPNTADFALSAAEKDVLFTFTSQDPDADKFGLVSASLEGSSTVHPELRNITYDFNARTFSGMCFGNNSTTPCAAGTYDDRSFLTFDVSVNGTRTVSRSMYQEWSLEDVLSIILYRVNATTGALAERMLQTSVGHCPNLKVCIPRDVARPDGVIPADILVPLGWMLNKQALWAVDCTTPHSNN